MFDSVKRRWRQWNVQRAYAGDQAAMDRLYLLGDPWGLDTTRERLRFRETARIIQVKIGEHLESLLEIGCGEGLQTAYFAPLAKRIVGLDPSAHAVKRARAKGIKNAEFEVGDLLSYKVAGLARYDLVTACEVLYYMKDLEEAYERLRVLGRACLVTYYEGVFERLDKFFAQKQLPSLTIHGAACKWRVVYWRQT